ncbi:MAG TPA: hypothetical protein VMW50_07275 [Dehalococcoidia bacterium]|nr:hypothetical protein [Dehalococcoidia bacterium]
MRLPSDLLHAISQPEGGRVVLVVGAGCSAEPPTSLPLSRELALNAHRKLVEDGVLDGGDCPEPDSLSCVADAVWSKTNSQRDLIVRFPCDCLHQAEPNRGHLLTAAMLYEQALSCVLTLNFDLALSNALSQIGAHGNVTIINKPEDYASFGLSNLVYLHRNVNADPDRWVLRSISLEESWRDGWEKIVTERVLSAPVTVFVGLGSSIGVLEESALRILDKLRGVVRVYQVDPSTISESSLFKKLGLPTEVYLQMSWCEFMDRLANRVVKEHCANLEQACIDQIQEHGWDSEDIHTLCQRITQDGLIKLGKIRARWTLNTALYLPQRSVLTKWIADLLIVVGFIERKSGSQAVFRPDGIIEFRRDNSIIGMVIAAHGQGYLRWPALEMRIKHSQQYNDYGDYEIVRAIISGVQGIEPTDVAPPENIVWQEEPNSLIPVPKRLKMYNIDRIREEPDLIMELLS